MDIIMNNFDQHKKPDESNVLLTKAVFIFTVKQYDLMFSLIILVTCSIK